MKFFCLWVVGERDVEIGYDFFWVVRFTNKKSTPPEFAACQFNSE